MTTSNAPTPAVTHNSVVFGLPTLLGVLIVLIFGGCLCIIGSLNWHEYEHDASVLIGLLAIGHGIDSKSRP